MAGAVSGPWEKYAGGADAGPWQKYGGGAAASSSDSPPEPPGFLSRFTSTVGDMLHLIPDLSVVPEYPGAPRSDVQKMPESIASADATRKQEGHGLAYRAGAMIVNPAAAQMEQAAREGDPRGVLGAAAGGAAMTAAPLAGDLALKGLNKIVPSTTRAGLGLNALTDSPTARFAQHPVDTPSALATARKIEAEHAVTGEKPPQQIKHYLANENVRNVPTEIADTLKAQGIDPSQPLSMYEARTMLKRVNESIGDHTLGGPTRNALKRFAGALDEDITRAAKQGGFGDEYQSFKNEYRRGSKTIRAGENVGPVVGGLAGAMLGRSAGALAATEAAGLGAVAGRYIGKPVIGGMVRSVIERNTPPPALRPVPTNAAAHLRTILDAKDGLIPPGEADRRIIKTGGRVKIRPIPQDQD